MVSHEPSELGMKGDELHIAYGLAITGCPRVPPAAYQSTRPVTGSQTTLLGGTNAGSESQQQDDRGHSPKAGVRKRHGTQE